MIPRFPRIIPRSVERRVNKTYSIIVEMQFCSAIVLFCSFVAMSITNFSTAKQKKFSIPKQPNFLFVLTDDQDITLGGMLPMVKTKKLIQDEGATFENMFVSNPLCCPSRASILTGRYAHNHGVTNNSVSGNCSSPEWQNSYEKETFAVYLKKAGYFTFYGGKYLNKYGYPISHGVTHIPSGWDHWAALVGNSRYYNYTLSVNGKSEVHGSDPNKDYLTDVLVQKALAFIENKSIEQPFFLMLCPPAPHSPFTPAASHEHDFSNMSAPRTPNFNVPGGKAKHWLLRQPPSPLPKNVISTIDEIFRNRLQTLESVDDAIEMLLKALIKRKLLENTYIIFSSDNGFHLGQFSMPWDKRQPYEFDIRVPLLIRGPGIKPGIVIKEPVLNIDLAPTFLDLAGIKPQKKVDGRSFSPLLSRNVLSNWRTSFIVEHQGEYSNSGIPGCPQYKAKEVHTCEIDCICEDSWNNTYVCLRTLSTVDNSLHCLFRDNESFMEAYNITDDPYELQNVFLYLRTELFQQKVKQLHLLRECFGESCHSL